MRPGMPELLSILHDAGDRVFIITERHGTGKNGVAGCPAKQRGKKGAKVILFTSFTSETVYMVFVLCRIGAVANLINQLFSEEKAIARINETEGRLMLDQLADRIFHIISQTCVKKTIIVPIHRFA